MKPIDWRDVGPEVMAPLYAAERTRWMRELDWDSSTNWVLIEAARAQGNLPGYVLFDHSGQAVGWAFYFLHEEVLQIGGLTGRSTSVARCLLDAIMRSPEAVGAKDVSCFVLPDQPASAAFVQRRFDSTSFLYLRRQVDGTQLTTGAGGASRAVHAADGATRLRPWNAADDAPDTVRLLGAVYGAGSSASASTAERCFAAGRGLDGWVHYVRQLIRTPACGILLPTASFAARSVDGRLCGVVLTTSIGPYAAHVAQLAVEPSTARQGFGRRLLDAACAAAASEGRRYVTLLVSEDNEPARALYSNTGFEERSQFLFGWRNRPIPRSAAA